MKKRNIKYRMLAVVSVLLCIWSCNSFLDVDPKGTVKQAKQFEDIQGYRDAMYGIYASMAQTDLYGKNLSYGFTDQLAQLFYDNYGTDPAIVAANYFKYKDQNLVGTIDGIWTQAYQAISYVNNVIVNIEKENLSKDSDYTLIKGEAYALRAFLHFDIMRLYCDVQPGGEGIPYAFTFDLMNKQVYSLKECFDHVLKDLTTAQQILVNDRTLSDNYANSAYGRNRRTHCNQYAVWALKARVFHYQGELDSAAFYAAKVLKVPELSLTTSDRFEEVKRYSRENPELIWGLYTTQLYSSYYAMFLEQNLGSGNVLWVQKNVRDFYEIGSAAADAKDKRFAAYFAQDQEEYYEYVFKRLLAKDEKSYLFSGLCLLRLPEMYYILAESVYAEDPGKALYYLNEVRRSRGLADLPLSSIGQPEDFRKVLIKEKCKEFWGEGQIFYTYKRDQVSFRDARDENDIQPSVEIFVLPWPKSEQEYGVNNH